MRRPGTQLAHFCGQNAAIESITVFKRIFARFLVLFEGSDPKNSMVFTSPNQLSLVLQKVSFLSLFGHLLAPKMLTLRTLGAQREAQALQEAPQKAQ